MARSCNTAAALLQNWYAAQVVAPRADKSSYSIARNKAFLASQKVTSIATLLAEKRRAAARPRKPRQKGLPPTRASQRLVEAEQAAAKRIEEEEQQLAAQQVAYTIAMNTAGILCVHTPASGRSTYIEPPVQRVSSEVYQLNLVRLGQEVQRGQAWSKEVMEAVMHACAADPVGNTRPLYDYTDEAVLFANCLVLQTGNVTHCNEGSSAYVRWTGPAAKNPAGYRALMYSRLVGTDRVGHTAVVVADNYVKVDGQPWEGCSSSVNACAVLHVGSVVDVLMHSSSDTGGAQLVTVTISTDENHT